ncbi:MAG: hypothetical protein NZX11_00455 [Thermus sp.]|nr:hypothetical protein [Thermus sp.]
MNDEEREALPRLVQQLSETTKQMREIERLPQSLLESYTSQGKAPRRDTVANLAKIRGSLAREIIGDRIIVEHDLEGKTLLRQGRGRWSFLSPSTLSWCYLSSSLREG